MKLYPRNPDIKTVNHADGDITASKDGSFEVPEETAVLLHAIGGEGEHWETQGEHSTRLVREEEERKNSPASMYELMEKFINSQSAKSGAAPTPAELRAQAKALLDAADAADSKKPSK